jgi:hypothetical protein
MCLIVKQISKRIMKRITAFWLALFTYSDTYCPKSEGVKSNSPHVRK